MELSKSGAIKFDHEGQTYNLMTNEYGEWSVSRGGIHLGNVPSLQEVRPMIEARKEAVRKRLAEVTAKHEARKAEREAEKATIASATKREDN